MIFTETSLEGAFVIELDRREDARGFFARSFCRQEFAQHNLKTEIAQCNISSNRKQGSLRGMHFQRPPRAEAKLVRCTRGAVYDVIIDLRPASPTFCRARRSLWTPEIRSAPSRRSKIVCVLQTARCRA